MFNETTWKEGEKLAQEYMKKHGYKILYTNYSCVGVELDIVAILPRKELIKELKIDYKVKIKSAKGLKFRLSLKREFKIYRKNIKNMLIITEVKARSTQDFGTGLESVTKFKRRNIIRGAKHLLRLKKFRDMPLRLDIASVDGNELTYYENAFSLNDAI